MEVLWVTAGMLLSIVLPLLVQLADRRRLRTRGQEGPWNVASWGSALYAFGPLSMLAWSHLTRPRPWRWLMGPAWFSALMLIVAKVSGDPNSGEEPTTALDWLQGFGMLFVIGVLLMLLVELIQWQWRYWNQRFSRRQHSRRAT